MSGTDQHIDHRAEAERLLTAAREFEARDNVLADAVVRAEMIHRANGHATLHVGDLLARVVGLLEPPATPLKWTSGCTAWTPGPTLDGRRFCRICGNPEDAHWAGGWVPPEPWRAEWLARRGPVSDRAAGCRWCSTGATADPCVCDPACEWSACVARAVAPPASTPQGDETPATHTRVTKEAPEAAETRTGASDGYRWQWSADGDDPWTFAAGRIEAREAAGPDGFVRRVSRLDGSPGRIMKANPGQRA